jgi:type I restriction enzyme R subunit
MNESEWQTRKLRIDARLRSLSPAWEIIPWRAGLDVARLERHIVTEIPTESGPADYGFFVRGLFLAILEAKRAAVNPQNVLEQAKRYSKGAFVGPGNWFGYRVPFLFASNGEIIWFLDVRRDKAASRILAHFHNAPALAEMFAFDPKPAHDWLLDTPPDLITRLREYQRRCNIATEQAIIAGRREILLALATGTGKTFLTVAQIYRLLESGLVRRILFLVDRKSLAAQAVREFNAFTTPKGNKFS